jgi:hypothetical protein
VIEAAKRVAARLFGLLGENRATDLTNLLVEFDVYRGIATGGVDKNDTLGAYTNLALYQSQQAEPAFLTALEWTSYSSNPSSDSITASPSVALLTTPVEGLRFGS